MDLMNPAMVWRMFRDAVELLIAAASESASAGLGWIGNMLKNPLSLISFSSRSISPPMAATGIPLADARRRTVNGSLPQML